MVQLPATLLKTSTSARHSSYLCNVPLEAISICVPLGGATQRDLAFKAIGAHKLSISPFISTKSAFPCHCSFLAGRIWTNRISTLMVVAPLSISQNSFSKSNSRGADIGREGANCSGLRIATDGSRNGFVLQKLGGLTAHGLQYPHKT